MLHDIWLMVMAVAKAQCGGNSGQPKKIRAVLVLLILESKFFFVWVGLKVGNHTARSKFDLFIVKLRYIFWTLNSLSDCPSAQNMKVDCKSTDDVRMLHLLKHILDSGKEFRTLLWWLFYIFSYPRNILQIGLFLSSFSFLSHFLWKVIML